MIHVIIICHATGARASFTPENKNFTYWTFQKIEASRWRKEDGKFITDNLTDEEAEYIEQLAKAQASSGDQVKLEVIGKPVPLAKPVKKKPEPEEGEQISLF